MTDNAFRGEAAATLKDGRELLIVLDWEALYVAEGVYRQPIPVMFADAGRGMFGAVCAILQGALAAHHPDLTRNVIMGFLPDNLATVLAAIGKAAEGAFPAKQKAEGKQGANPPAPKRRTGKS